MLMSGVEAGALVATVVTFCTTATLITWMRGRRGGKPTADAGAHLSEDRVTQIEHALEAIAIEVERIAEGQRFTARLLAERIEREARAGDQAAFRDPDGMRRTTPV
jgi:hypothetical protein